MRFLARLGVLLAFVMAPGWAFALPPVWTVHNHDSTVTLFGSVHLLPEGLAWRPPALDQALAGADQVWFETPMDPAGRAAASQAAQAHAFLPQGQSLLHMLSSEDRARLDKAAAMLGVASLQFDRLQPWYADLAISAAVYEKVGAKQAEGVEEQLWAAVPPTVVKHEFETPEEQIGFFADAALPDQVASLEQTLKEAATAEHDYQVLLKAWLDGDIKTLDREVVRPMRKASPSLYATLVQKRNARWVEDIVARMQAPGHTVIIVGMGHLIGPDGLPARLRALGYEVEGPR
jgi:uncharacterized protein YbaP (TraB family)